MNSLLINYYELIKIDPPRVQNSDIFAFCLSWLLPLLSGPHANRPQPLPDCLLLRYNVSWRSAKRRTSGFLLKKLWQGHFCQQVTIFLISQAKKVPFSPNSDSVTWPPCDITSRPQEVTDVHLIAPRILDVEYWTLFLLILSKYFINTRWNTAYKTYWNTCCHPKWLPYTTANHSHTGRPIICLPQQGNPPLASQPGRKASF